MNLPANESTNESTNEYLSTVNSKDNESELVSKNIDYIDREKAYKVLDRIKIIVHDEIDNKNK